MPQPDLGRTGLLSDSPPPPAPVVLPPSPDFRRATELVKAAEKAAIDKYKSLVKTYYACVLKLAGGSELDPAEVPEFQRSIRLLKKQPEVIAVDVGEGRKILEARKWMAAFDEKKNRAEIATETAIIETFNNQLQREISRIRNAAAPHYARLEQLQRTEVGVINTRSQAEAWQHWLDGRFEISKENLDRAGAAL